MVNGTEWLVVTKLDVLDSLAEIPVCTHYRIEGKDTDVIPADIRRFEQIEPVYTRLPGWQSSTEGISSFDGLPANAQKYLHYLEEHSSAKIGMVSTGPDRNQTFSMPDFDQATGVSA